MPLTHKDLMEEIRRVNPGINTDIINAMSAVDRKLFIPPEWQRIAYSDEPLHIGFGQTCSQPSTVALMMHYLQLEKGMRVYEIGTGCGYHIANVASFLGEKGRLTSVETIPELARNADVNLQKTPFYENINLLTGDGATVDFVEPFDRVYLTAAAKPHEFDPDTLANKLLSKGLGIMLYPLKEESDGSGPLIRRIYVNGLPRQVERLGKVRFVDLVSE